MRKLGHGIGCPVWENVSGEKRACNLQTVHFNVSAGRIDSFYAVASVGGSFPSLVDFVGFR